MKTVLVPTLEILVLRKSPTPWVKVRRAITAATPMKMPRAVSSERKRLAQRASKALPKLAPIILPRLNPRPRSCGSALSAGGKLGGDLASGIAGNPVFGGLLIAFPP